MGRIFYALAIAFMPITNAASILQATPLVVVLGAVIFLNEKVGWRRWTAILTGWASMSFEALIFLLANAAAGVSAYFCLTIAMRVGDVSFVTPFRYVRVLFALFFGIVLLGENPNLYILLGSGIVVLSGIYIITTNKK